MKIDLLDIDRLIEVNKLMECDSPRLFSTKMTFDSNGILSNEIFGISKNDRRNTFAYISLKRKFIHPHIYHKVLKSIYRGVIYIVAGQRYYSVKNGILVEDPDNGWTGLDNLYKHWNEIDWRKSKSANNTNKELLINLNRDDIFIDKILVCPPAYRDVMIAGTIDSSDHINELNDLYTRLIRAVALIQEGGLFARTQYATQSKIQDTIVEISEYFKHQISRKQGLIRKNLIGKSVDYGVRAVISAPTYNHENIRDNIIDVEHTAVPISMCCSTFYPFIEAWLKNFFTREIINDPNIITFYDRENNKEFTGVIKDPELQFSDKNIRKMINDYCLNPDNRYRPIIINVESPYEKNKEALQATLLLKGKKILPNNISTVLKRPMTITDILYIACVETCEKRHIMVSRYPVGTDKGIYFNKIRVRSTIKCVNVIFNGKEYPYYPDIDDKILTEKVGIQFIDTIVLSNSHLDGMGADYDGDILSIRGLWSDEANMEAEQIMNQKMSALNITGANSKSVAKEVFNSLYELTKESNDKVKTLGAFDTEQLLSLTPDGINRSLLVSLFADTVDASNKNVNGKRKSKFNTWDRMTVPKDYFYKGQPAIETTIGRFIANKFILQGPSVIGLIPFINKVMNKEVVSDLDKLIGQLYMEDKINRKQFNDYLDYRDTLGYWLNGILAHTISSRMAKPLPEIEKKKAELCKKYEKELAEGNLDIMTQISDELVAYAKEILKDDPGMDLYLSGDLDFGNNYKNNSIIKGAVINKITGEYDFIETSFMDGIAIKDLPAHANSILASQYPASIATASAGYMGKKLLALLQMMEIDEPDTDCHTKNLVPVTITNHNKSDMMYTYIKDGDGLLELTPENISSFIGKTVLMRSPMTCLNDKICSKCAGKLFYMLDVKHAGLFATQISHSALNLALKAKHNSLVELFTLNPDTLIEDL